MLINHICLCYLISGVSGITSGISGVPSGVSGVSSGVSGVIGIVSGVSGIVSGVGLNSINRVISCYKLCEFYKEINICPLLLLLFASIFVSVVPELG